MQVDVVWRPIDRQRRHIDRSSDLATTERQRSDAPGCLTGERRIARSQRVPHHDGVGSARADHGESPPVSRLEFSLQHRRLDDLSRHRVPELESVGLRFEQQTLVTQPAQGQGEWIVAQRTCRCQLLEVDGRLEDRRLIEHASRVGVESDDPTPNRFVGGGGKRSDVAVAQIGGLEQLREQQRMTTGSLEQLIGEDRGGCATGQANEHAYVVDGEGSEPDPFDTLTALDVVDQLDHTEAGAVVSNGQDQRACQLGLDHPAQGGDGVDVRPVSVVEHDE